MPPRPPLAQRRLPPLPRTGPMPWVLLPLSMPVTAPWRPTAVAVTPRRMSRSRSRLPAFGQPIADDRRGPLQAAGRLLVSQPLQVAQDHRQPLALRQPLDLLVQDRAQVVIDRAPRDRPVPRSPSPRPPIPGDASGSPRPSPGPRSDRPRGAASRPERRRRVPIPPCGPARGGGLKGVLDVLCSCLRMARQVATTIGPCRTTSASNAGPSRDEAYLPSGADTFGQADERSAAEEVAKVLQSSIPMFRLK